MMGQGVDGVCVFGVLRSFEILPLLNVGASTYASVDIDPG